MLFNAWFLVYYFMYCGCVCGRRCIPDFGLLDALISCSFGDGVEVGGHCRGDIIYCCPGCGNRRDPGAPLKSKTNKSYSYKHTPEGSLTL